MRSAHQLWGCGMAHRSKPIGKAERFRSDQTDKLIEFGVRLAQKRERLGLTQREMAEHIGTSQSRISRIEMGLGTPKDFPTAQAYASCYQLNEGETQAWFQLLFGVTSTSPSLPPPTADSASGKPWNVVAATHLLEVATTLHPLLLWEESLPLCRKAEALLGITPEGAYAACQIGYIYTELGDYERAQQEVQRIQATYAAVLDWANETRYTLTSGWIAYDTGNFAEAAIRFEHCLTLTTQAGNEQLSTHAHHFLGRVYCGWGQTLVSTKERITSFHQARSHLQRAYELHRRWGEQGDLAFDLLRQAQVSRAEGDWRQAQQLRAETRSLSGSELISLHVDMEEATLLLQEGNVDSNVFVLAENALRGWAQVKRARGMASALRVLGMAHQHYGNLEVAGELLVAARCIYPFVAPEAQAEHWNNVQQLVRKVTGTSNPLYVQHLYERAMSRQGYFIYLDDVIVDNSANLEGVFAQLRAISAR